MQIECSVLVQVDQIAEWVVEDRIHAAVVNPRGLPDEHDPPGLKSLGITLAVIRAQ
jgi:hypothetical protein